jgi:hypothetical protein
MQANTQTRTSAQLAWTRAVVAFSGIVYLLTGLTQLVAPFWFYTYIGNLPPFNRHYIGDLGSFLLPLGIGLLVAAKNPRAHRLLIGVAALGGLLHAMNHLYDEFASPLEPAPLQSPLLLLFALSLAIVWLVER